MTRRALAGFALLVAAFAVAGCATAPSSGAGAPAAEAASSVSKTDPWERLNRRIFDFNEAVDAAVLKPVAQGYRAVVPEVVRTGVDNMIGNLGDVWSAANLVLQGKPRRAGEMGVRVIANTVFGLLGFFDVATDAGLDKQSEDFGQTLAVWGMGSGPYMVLPVLGPSTLRDTAALPVDLSASPSNLAFHEVRDQNGGTLLQVISTRARLLSASRALDDVALDKYTLLRDAYLARRRNQVYDGEPPDEEEEAEQAQPAGPMPAEAAKPAESTGNAAKPVDPKPAEPKPAK